MRVLLTGAAGYIGKAAVEVLGRDHDLRLLDINPLPGAHDMLVGDVSDFACCTRAVAGMDAVVHLAFVNNNAPGSYDLPEPPMRVNVQGMVSLLEAARRVGIRRVVHMSSCAVVTGYSRDTFIHAAIPLKFRGLYGLTKALQEHVCRQYADEHGMVVVALRPWSVVDGLTMTDAGGGRLARTGDFMPFVCRYDLAEACARGLIADLDGFQAFHILVGEGNERCFDLQRTRQALGWHPKTTFDSLS